MGFDRSAQKHRTGRRVERGDDPLPGTMSPDRNQGAMTARERLARPFDPCMPRVSADSEVIRPAHRR
ncbi:MAG: hypothetical protein AB7G13_06795 [Lautropia sp.]